VTRDSQQPPPAAVSLVVGGVSVVAVAASAWLATQPRAEQAQEGLVRWFNDPPQPVSAVLALANPLLRPWPLFLLSVVLISWVLIATPSGPRRVEVVRALALALAVAEVMAQVLKQLADQERPLAVIGGLDTHGYPTDPHGNAYPSAHTALVVAAVSAAWPWVRWPQRIAGLTLAVLVATNRIYIGAHWPIDVVGGAAIGLLAGAIAWLVAVRWPIRARSPSPVA
jgi:membrane-associated phospholipid phosphatase